MRVEELAALIRDANEVIAASRAARGAVEPPELVEPAESIYRPISFTEAEWARLRTVADGANALSDKASNTRWWNKDSNFIGLVGEACYSRIAGVPFFPERRMRQLADGGEDFPGVDVKGTGRESPSLLCPASDPLKARAYALVHVLTKTREARYLGWATREEVAVAPTHDRGFGPSMEIWPRDLRRGLPPVPSDARAAAAA